MSKPADGPDADKTPDSAKIAVQPAIAMRPSDMSTAAIAGFLFLLLWLIVQINFSLVLGSIPPEQGLAITMLSANSLKLFAFVAVLLIAGIYAVIYKFVLNGQRDAAAIGVAAKFAGGAIGLAAIVANARVAQFVDMVSMFENTAGLFYIRTVYPTQLHSIMSLNDTVPVSKHAHDELAAIFLSRIGVAEMCNTPAEIKKDADTSIGEYDLDVLRRMVALKNMVAQFCWMLFAAIVATLASIPELASIA
jgi:hypothetical protein